MTWVMAKTKTRSKKSPSGVTRCSDSNSGSVSTVMSARQRPAGRDRARWTVAPPPTRAPARRPARLGGTAAPGPLPHPRPRSADPTTGHHHRRDPAGLAAHRSPARRRDDVPILVPWTQHVLVEPGRSRTAVVGRVATSASRSSVITWAGSPSTSTSVIRSPSATNHVRIFRFDVALASQRLRGVDRRRAIGPDGGDGAGIALSASALPGQRELASSRKGS